MAIPPTLWDFFQRAVFPRLAVEAVYQDVLFGQRGGRYWQGRCPFPPAQDPPAPICVDVETLRWSCPAHCHRGGQSVLAYLNGGRFPQPGTGEHRAAVERAVGLAGVSLPATADPDPGQERRLVQRERTASLLEAFFFQAHFALLQSSGRQGAAEAAREFLAEGGFDQRVLRDLPVGLFVDRRLVGGQLAEMGFSPQEIAASQLAADPRLDGRLVGPIRDPDGRIVSFWALHPADRAPRYLFKGRWREPLGLIGLDAALRPSAGGREHLVLVEHLWDALLLQSRGFPNVAAVGGPVHLLTRQRWRRLAALGIRRVTIAVSADEQQWDQVLRTLAAAFPTRSGPKAFLLPPGSFPDGRGIGPWVRDCGLEAFQSLLETQAVDAYRYKAATVLGKRPAYEPPVCENRPAALALYVVGDAWRERGDADEPLDGGAAPRSPTLAGICRVHHCPATECFCFD